jgi:hypothetical protein
LQASETTAAANACSSNATAEPGGAGTLEIINCNFIGDRFRSRSSCPEEAFKVSVTAAADGNLDAHFSIAKDYYLYRDKIAFKVTEPLPESSHRHRFPTRRGKGTIPTSARCSSTTSRSTPSSGSPACRLARKTLQMEATHQGCSDNGICYPPQDVILSVDLSARLQSGGAKPATEAKQPTDTSDTGRVTAILQGGNYWLVIISFFGFGLLLSLTPCVFPMIPILSGIIVGQGQQITKRKGFMLSLAYVLGMAVTYAMAGVAAAGLSGTLISNALQNPWALGTGARSSSRWHFDVRFLRTADAQLPAEPLHRSQQPHSGRPLHQRIRDGRHLGADRRPLRRCTSGGRAAVHQPDQRCRARRRIAVLAGHRHGRSAVADRPVGRRRCCRAPAAGWMPSSASSASPCSPSRSG